MLPLFRRIDFTMATSGVILGTLQVLPDLDFAIDTEVLSRIFDRPRNFNSPNIYPLVGNFLIMFLCQINSNSYPLRNPQCKNAPGSIESVLRFCRFLMLLMISEHSHACCGAIESLVFLEPVFVTVG